MLTTDTRPRLTDLFPVGETGCSAHDGVTLTAMVRDGGPPPGPSAALEGAR